MRVEHGDQKYRITFVKSSSTFDRLHTRSRPLMPNDFPKPRNIESLLSDETSTVADRTSTANTSNIHRESKKEICSLFCFSFEVFFSSF